MSPAWHPLNRIEYELFDVAVSSRRDVCYGSNGMGGSEWLRLQFQSRITEQMGGKRTVPAASKNTFAVFHSPRAEIRDVSLASYGKSNKHKFEFKMNAPGHIHHRLVLVR